MTGTFDDWAGDRIGLARDGDGSSGTWSVDVAGVEPGTEYRFTIRTADGDLSRIDPYARHVTSSIGNGDRVRPGGLRLGRRRLRHAALGRPCDLRDARRHVRAAADRPGTFDAPAGGCPTSSDLGVSAIQVMPPFEFAGDISWGYNPAHLFAIESAYGGPDAFKRSCARPTSTASRSSSTSSTTTSARPTWTCGGSTAGPRATAAGSTSTTMNGRHAVGRDPARLRSRRGPHVPARQRHDLARGVPVRRPALRCHGAHPDRRGLPGQTRLGRPARRLVVPGLDQRRDPGPPAVEDHDRRGHRGRPDPRDRRPPTAGPGSGRSGTPGSSAGSGRRSRSPTTPPAT